MRRSQAPSMRKAAKRAVSELEDTAISASVLNVAPMKWGTAGGGQLRDSNENPLKNKRIFRVLWRNCSTKKHKTWQGDGTLEVSPTLATLKDDTGKYLGEISCFKQEHFKLHQLLECGSKEIELQEEFTTAEQCLAQRKLEDYNFEQKIEEESGLSSRPIYDVSKPQKPHKNKLLNKNKQAMTAPPYVQASNETPWGTRGITAAMSARSSAPAAAVSYFMQSEYICMLQPSELQVQALRTCSEFYAEKTGTEMPDADIMHIAQQICDHPVLLQHHNDHGTALMQLLLSQLPPWQQMDLYDSAKFEFVHLLLDTLIVESAEKCAVVADSQASLDIIKGYCEHCDIRFAYLGDMQQAMLFNAADSPAMVALILTKDAAALRLTCCKYLIFYNCNRQTDGLTLLSTQSNTTTYTLITTDSLEERRFQQQIEGGEQLACHELLLQADATSCGAPAGWHHWQPPYSEEFLQNARLSAELECLSYIYSKQTKTTTKSTMQCLYYN